MLDVLQGIMHNYIAQAAFWGWFSAQLIKFLVVVVRHRTLRLERLVGSGGFPSSHTSFIISTTTAIYLKEGASSDLFILAIVMSCIVMYDATGVRRESGKQAEVLNQIISYFTKRGIPVTLKSHEQTLKELLGHTPIEVLGGVVLGIFIAWFQYTYLYQGLVQ